MDEYIGDREEGFLVETDNRKMLSPETLFRDGFKTIFKKMGRAGVRSHAIDYWMGHENPEMSTRYGKQLLEDVKYRKRWAEKGGLGFELPRGSEPKLDVSCATCDTDSAMQACVKCVSDLVRGERPEL